MAEGRTTGKHRLAASVLRRVLREPAGPEGGRDPDLWFEEALGSTERFFSRLPELSFEGKSVLDYGCGIGATPIWLAGRGAVRAVGIDIQSVDFAEAKLERDYPHLRDRVSFHRIEPSQGVGEERFDLVISKDTFEHVDDPDAYVATMKGYLKPDGEIAIGFGPLWRSPWGGHIDFMTRLPWAHLVFPEQVILSERRRYRPEEDPSRFEEIRGGLNRMTLARFLETMARSGLVHRYLSTNRSEGARTRGRGAVIGAMRIGSRIPGLREYCTLNVYSVWSRG